MSLLALYQRQFLLLRRRPEALIHGFLFFLIFLFTLPMMIDFTPAMLQEAISGLVWMGCLFLALLTADGLFQTAYMEGVLQQAYVAGVSLPKMVFAMLLVHTVCLLLPVLMIVPCVVWSLGLPFTLACTLDLGLLMGMPTLIAFTALAAAFQVGLIQKVTFMAFIVLPLVIPILIWGSALVSLFSLSQTGGLGLCAILLAFSLLSLSTLPFAIAGILKLRFEG